MNTRVRLCFITAVLGLAVTVVFANDLKSVSLAASGAKDIHVAGDEVLTIRNFTQDGGATRGVVTATIGGVPTNVLAAAIIDPAAEPEIINEVVIAGPADVTATCGSDATGGCVISYRKDKADDSD